MTNTPLSRWAAALLCAALLPAGAVIEGDFTYKRLVPIIT